MRGVAARLSQSPFQFFSAVRKYAGKDFSHLQRAKSTGGFFDRGVIGGCHYSSQ